MFKQNSTERTIKNKEECYKLYQRGSFGNKVLLWNSYSDLLKSSWRGDVCIRSRDGMERRKVRYNIPFKDVREVIEDFKKNGVSENSLSFNQSMPDEELLLQGEVTQGPIGFELTYTTVKKPMNCTS